MELKEKVEALFGVIFVIAFLGAWFGWSDALVGTLIEWITAIIVSVILSGIAGSIIEAVSGDFFKTITITIPIGPGGFSVSLFVIFTLLLKWVLF